MGDKYQVLLYEDYEHPSNLTTSNIGSFARQGEAVEFALQHLSWVAEVEKAQSGDIIRTFKRTPEGIIDVASGEVVLG